MSATLSDIEVKPCACGRDANVNFFMDKFVIQCLSCYNKIRVSIEKKDLVIQFWNERVSNAGR